MPSVADCLKTSIELQKVSDSPRLDTEILLAHALQKDRSWLFTWPEKQVPVEQHYRFLQLMSRRTMGEPIAYLIGRKGFWSLDLEVNEHTLIPRPETELLVELALRYLPADAESVLDLGTGTGAIALALAKEKPGLKITAVDCVAEALALAKCNADRNQVSNVEFIQSNWFANIPAQTFSVIVSNPPYIDAEDRHLQEGDVRYEPKTALVAENKGYADLEQIITQAKPFLAPGGLLLLEHGYSQGEKVREIFTANGYEDVQTFRDLEERERATLGRFFSELS